MDFFGAGSFDVLVFVLLVAPVTVSDVAGLVLVLVVIVVEGAVGLNVVDQTYVVLDDVVVGLSTESLLILPATEVSGLFTTLTTVGAPDLLQLFPDFVHCWIEVVVIV